MPHATTTEKPTVNTPDRQWEEMRPALELTGDLLGGTPAMRARRERYLPQYEDEEDEAYDRRVGCAVLSNMFKRALKTLSSKPFTEPITLGEDVPPTVVELLADVDLQGNDLDTWAQVVFEAAMSDGLTHMLVEYPRMDAENAAEEAAAQPRPYWCHVRASALIGARYEMRNGRRELVEARIRECREERDPENPWGTVTKEYVRVLTPGRWEVYSYDALKKDWFVIDEGTTEPIPYVPLVTVYFEKPREPRVVDPPLIDLAYLNVQHFQGSSEQQNALTVARFPVLCGTGIGSEKTTVTLGPTTFLTAEDPEAKYYFLEHSGAAIEAGRMSQQDIEAQMAMLGVELLRRPGTVTATEKAIDSSQQLNALQRMTMAMGDALERLLEITSEWMGLGEGSGGSLTLYSDFGLVSGDAVAVGALSAARTGRDISRVTYVHELKRRGVLSEDFDPEHDAEELDEEVTASLAEAAARMELGAAEDPDPARQIQNKTQNSDRGNV